MISKKYIVFEIILFIALLGVGIYGAVRHLKSAERKSGGDITIQNYNDYINMDSAWSDYDPYGGGDCEYRVSFSCKESTMRVSDLEIIFSLEAEYARPNKFSKKIELIKGWSDEYVRVTVHLDLPPETPGEPVFPEPFPKINVLEISGHYYYEF